MCRGLCGTQHACQGSMTQHASNAPRSPPRTLRICCPQIYFSPVHQCHLHPASIHALLTAYAGRPVAARLLSYLMRAMHAIHCCCCPPLSTPVHCCCSRHCFICRRCTPGQKQRAHLTPWSLVFSLTQHTMCWSTWRPFTGVSAAHAMATAV